MLRSMKRTSSVSLLIVALLAVSLVTGVGAKEPKILEFDSMVGVPPALTGTQAPIRGVNGGGLPWEIDAASGELTADGHLEIDVRGLVFAAGPNVGRNTVTSFRATVSCLTDAGAIANVTTGTFPATLGFAADGGGNAQIEADVALPQPCLAPIVFVTSPGGAWFAVIGG
jgi:hypothetical protein